MFRPQLLAVLLTIVLTSACHKKNDNTLLSVVPSAQSNIKFTNKLPERKLFNILYYLYFYNGGGVAVGDVNGDGLTDIYYTANTKGNNKLYINKGNFQFEDATDKAGVRGSADWCSGATMVDVNADGKLDIMVSAISGKFGLKGHNELFINNGNGTFSEQSEQYGLNFSGLSVQTAFFDYDHDGDLDCYLLNQSYFPHSNVVSIAKRNTYDSLAGDVLYRNDINKTGKYTVVSKDAGIYQSNLGYGLGLAVADLNKDGWDDIYIGNDFHENDYYYINQKNGTFKESGADHFKHYSRFSMGNDINDYNNDGEPDVITVDMLPPDEKTVKTYGSDENLDIYNVKLMSNGYQHQYSRNCLQRNNGSGASFSDVALITNVFATDWSWAPLFADFDNDGKKDLFISSGIVKRPVDLDYVRFVSDLSVNKGMDKTDKYDDDAIKAMPDGSSHPFFFKNNDEYSFSDKSAEWGTATMKGYFNGAAYADLDNDGDLDMVINSLNSESFVMKNNLTGKQAVSVSFEGDSLNRFGIGAKLYLFAGGQMQYQQMNLTRGFQSSVEPRLHFGLDAVKNIDSLLVVWPNQTYEVVKNIKSGSAVKLSYKNAKGVFDYESLPKPATIAYEPLTLTDWKHQENDFIDFNVQYLIPHQESTRGPKIAVADVNGDGLDDMYVCGGRGQSKAIYIQQPNGKFIATNTDVFKLDQTGEDVDALFFDANGDKFPDLLVVTGGNQVLESGREGADRLYINDGKGKFTLNELAFSIQYESKSCVTTADIDKDGDADFFIGNLSNPGKYGEPTNSYLYLNKGNGTFDMATASTAFFQQLGMVTDAEFADVNNDSWPDLIVVGEWMPVKIFLNNKGKFGSAIDLPASTGLWQSVFVTDINKDGKLDLLAGNWGHNSKLSAGKNGPLKLYVKDFDNNSSVEQVMCYTIDGKEYTFLAKDELERALPVLKKGYLKYDEVAGKTVQFMFDDLFKEYRELKAEVLGSSVFINQGNATFERKDLPAALQLSPIFSFSPMENKPGSYIAAGNFYGVIPYEGRYDAQIPTVFNYNASQKKIEVGAQFNKITSEVRDVKWLRGVGNSKIMVVASNNSGLQFLKMN
jgi:hypothetical protein